MKFRGSLFFYGPFNQRLLLDGVNRDFPKFKYALSAEMFARKHRLRFVDLHDPTRVRFDPPARAGRPALATRRSRGERSEPPYLVYIKHSIT